MHGSRKVSGAQTLARGLLALREVVRAPNGLSIQEVADLLGVHRTIAYRMLVTLSSAGLIIRGDDARYRGAAGLLELRAAGYETLKHVAKPFLETLADELKTTVALLVSEQDEAIALLVVEPRKTTYRIAFSVGSRHPLDRGAAGHALCSVLLPEDEGSEMVQSVREVGYVITFSEVERGAWGLAVPVKVNSSAFAACLNLITYREDVARGAVERVKECVVDLERALEKRI